MKLKTITNLSLSGASALLYLVLNHFLDWPIVRLGGIHAAGFADMASVLMAASCERGFLLPWQSLGEDCQSYIYGNTLLNILNFANINTSLASGASFLLAWAVMTVLLVFVFKSRVSGYAKVLFIAVVCLSPALNLLFERGNLDSLVFLLTFFSALLLVNKRPLFAFLVIALAALIKFYSLPLLLIFPFFQKNKKMQLLMWSISAFIATVIILEALRVTDFPLVDTAQFGVSAWAYYPIATGIPFGNSTFWMILGFTLFVFMLLFAKHTSFTNWTTWPLSGKTNLEGDLRSTFFLFSAVTLFFCYFSGVNYDYRLVFLAGMFVSFPLQKNSKYSTLKPFAFVASTALMFTAQPLQLLFISGPWPTSLLPLVLQFVGDFAVTWLIVSMTISVGRIRRGVGSQTE